MRAAFPAWGLALVGLFACGPELEPSAPDASLLIVPESYHRAMNAGGHVSHVGRARDGGALIACRDCHALEDAGFASPSATPCRRCHEAQGGFTHGHADAGMPDAGAVSCLSCHPFGEQRRGRAFVTPWLCLDCHDRPQGTRVAVEVHRLACAFCHQPHGEPFTQPTECTTCHAVGLAHGAKGATPAETCMKCHEPHRRAQKASAECLTCHSDAKVTQRPAAHVTSQALFDGHPGCGSCHRPHRFVRRDVKDCASCHEGQPVLAALVTPKAHAACTDCHPPHAPRSPPSACSSCHKTLKAGHPAAKEGPHAQDACRTCHPPHDPRTDGKVALGCNDCHEGAAFAGVVHAQRKGGEALSCVECHPPHKPSGPPSCRECHATVVAAVGKVKRQGHGSCTQCHAGLPHKPLAEKKPCLSCHPTAPPTQKGHEPCGLCHDPHSGARAKDCAGCHPAAKLEGLHAVKKHDGCTKCHRPHGPQPDEKESCSGCHPAPKKHDPSMVRCSGCHLFRAAR